MSLVGFGEGPRLLRRRAVELFGPEPADRQTRIMVTLPPQAASDPSLVLALVEHGMNLARINCAHDNAAAWAAMIGHVRTASAATGRECRVEMDLPGPKVRTGPLADGPRVIKLRPTRDTLGRVIAPARCWLTPAKSPHPPPHPGLPVLPMPETWLTGLGVDDRIELADTHGARRHLVVETTEHEWNADRHLAHRLHRDRNRVADPRRGSGPGGDAPTHRTVPDLCAEATA